MYNRDLYGFLTSGREDRIEPDFDAAILEETKIACLNRLTKIACLNRLADFLAVPDHTEVSVMSDTLYKNTDCGARLRLSPDGKGIYVESIVEGSDFEFSEMLKFIEDTDKFRENFWDLVERCEKVCEEVWVECNGDDDE